MIKRMIRFDQKEAFSKDKPEKQIDMKQGRTCRVSKWKKVQQACIIKFR